MNLTNRAQILNLAISILHNAKTLGKGMNLIILPPAVGKYGLHSSSDIQFSCAVSFPSLWRDNFRCTKYNWYHCHLHVSQLFLLSGKKQLFVYLFTSIYFHFIVHWCRNIHYMTRSFFLVNKYNIVWQWSWRPGFNPKLSHTKDSKNGT